jgi:hypothetical protein
MIQTENGAIRSPNGFLKSRKVKGGRFQWPIDLKRFSLGAPFESTDGNVTNGNVRQVAKTVDWAVAK